MSTCPRCQQPIPFDLPQCPQCDGPLASSLPAGLENRVRELLDQQAKLQAIKLFREETGSSLIEAKFAVDRMQQERLPGASDSAGAQVDHGSTDDASASDSWEAEVLRLVTAGKRIQAIRLYRDQHRVGLRQARLAVDALAERHGISPSDGSLPVIVLFAFLAAVLLTTIAGGLWLLFG